MEEIKRLVVDKVNSGDVIVPNFLGTGADLIASGSVE
jgi:CxxC motif-containing protein